MTFKLRSVARLGILFGFCFGATACTEEFPLLEASECPQIVAHSKKLLGDGVKGKSDEEMLGVCRASTPRQRGCVKMATEGADVMKCSLVRD